MRTPRNAAPDGIAVKDEIPTPVVLLPPIVDQLEGLVEDLVFVVIFPLDLDRDHAWRVGGHGTPHRDDGCAEVDLVSHDDQQHEVAEPVVFGFVADVHVVDVGFGGELGFEDSEGHFDGLDWVCGLVWVREWLVVWQPDVQGW